MPFLLVYRLTHKLGKTKALREAGAKEVKRSDPNCNHHEYDSDAFWECVGRHNTMTNFHQAGTCKMGAVGDPTAVVDPKLR